MADRSQVAAILADPDATPQEKYETLVANGWDKQAASRATGYTPAAGATPSVAEAQAKRAEMAAKKAEEAAGASTQAAQAAIPAAQAASGAAQTAIDPMARFKELTAKMQSGQPLSQSEQNEFKALVAKAPEMSPGGALWTPAQTQASFDAQKAAEAAKKAPAPAPAIAAPKAGPTAEESTADFEAARTAAGQAAREAALKAGKSDSEAAAIALEAYMNYGLDAAKATGVDAVSGAAPTIPPIAPKPPHVSPGVSGPAHGIDDDTTTTAAVAAVDTAMPDATPDVKADQVDKLKEAAQEPGFAEKANKISRDLGVTLLEAIQAGMLGYIGGATGNWQKTAYQLRVEREEREKAAATAETARREEAAAAQKKWIEQMGLTREQLAAEKQAAEDQRAWQAAEAQRERLWQSIENDKSLSSAERIAAKRAAASEIDLSGMSEEQRQAYLKYLVQKWTLGQ